MMNLSGPSLSLGKGRLERWVLSLSDASLCFVWKKPFISQWWVFLFIRECVRVTGMAVSMASCQA